jgi:transcriptional regulator with XRE-family HTH domain
LRPNTEFSAALGRAIRDRRRALGLTQTELGSPFTKGFVSEVERGRSLPSLRALTFLADRLDIPVSELLESVKGGLSGVYTPPDENEHPPTATSR